MERFKGANGELMKYSMQPMDGKGRLTLYRYDQLAVGGADNAHLEFWIEIEELRKQLADAQATIAALQARVQELESNRVPNSMQHVIELQAMNNRLGVRVETLEAHLTQRTAELEAAKRDRDELQSVFDLGHTRTVEADKLWQDAHGKPEVWPDLGDLVGWLIKRHDDVQAELERVRAASNKDNKTGQMMLDDAIRERDDLRTLILALPKVEGVIEVKGRSINERYPTLSWQIASTGMDEFTNAIAALLRHRQGMEG